MFLRLYFILRASFNYSIYSDAYSRNICKNHDFYPGFRFILKSRLVNNPETTVLTMLVTSVLVLAFMLRVFEVRYAQNPKLDEVHLVESKYFSQVYVIIITMTTVGYGDLKPETDPGKIVCMFAALFGAFMISLMVLIVSQAFELKKDQKDALKRISISRVAVSTISKGFRFYFAKKRYHEMLEKTDPSFKSAFLDFFRKG